MSNGMSNSQLLSRVLVASAVTTTATTGALLLLSRKDTGHPAAALNATSHILWGDEAVKHNGIDLRHTLAGGILNAGAMAMWSAVQQIAPQPRSLWAAARNAALVTLLAYGTDYHVVPRRLTPGFERRLSKNSLFVSYAVMAVSLAASALLTPKRRHR